MEKVKLSLSRVDRTIIFGMIPTIGNLEAIKKSIKFMDEIKFTDQENEVDLSFNQIHDPREREVARESWYNTQEDYELSLELVDLIKSEVRSREESKAFNLNSGMSIEFIEKFL